MTQTEFNWPDGTPKSQGNAFDLSLRIGASISAALQTQERKSRGGRAALEHKAPFRLVPTKTQPAETKEQ